MVLTELEKKEKRAKYMKEYNRQYNEKNKEQMKEYREKNKEKIAEYRIQYQKENREKRRIYEQQYRNSPAGKKIRTRSQWKRRGLDMDTFDNVYPIYLATTHCDRCNIFLISDNGANQKCMDHCHATGMYRNTVCKNCNLNVIR